MVIPMDPVMWWIERCSVITLLAVAACGDDTSAPLDAPLPEDTNVVDLDSLVAVDAAVDSPRNVTISGSVDFQGALPGVYVSSVDLPNVQSITDIHGDYGLDWPDGQPLVMRAVPVDRPELRSMIRGVIAHDQIRHRVFYLLGPPDEEAAASLGHPLDDEHAIVEVDFRNASIGGYGVMITIGGAPVTPAFGIAYDAEGAPHLSQVTVSGGDGSTLLLGGLPVGTASFTPIVPAGATLPCEVRDYDPLPLEAGVVTWVDFECGGADD